MKKNILMLAALGLLTITSCEKKEENVVVTDEDSNIVEGDGIDMDDTMEHDMDDTMEHDMDESTFSETLNLTFAAKSDSNLSGTADLTQEGDKVTMQVNLSGLTPGTHAIHIHENGDCSSADGKSAGGHWNPTGDEHGKFEVESYHMGDIGNLEAGEDGKASLTFSTDKWCLDCDDDTKNIKGKSIIVHKGADDFTSQPSGDAGGRIGCVVIE